MLRRRRLGTDQLALVARAQAGDREAVEELLVETEGLVRKVATAYLPHFAGHEYEDLLQVGRLGVLAAIERFDATRGLRFSTLAVWWVRSYIGKARQNDGLIHLPYNITQTPSGRAAHPDPPHIARSLDEKVDSSHDERSFLGDLLPADDDTEAEALAELRQEWIEVCDAVDRLPRHERDAIALRYGLDDGIERSLEECGRLLGLSRQGAHTRCATAIKRLRYDLRKRR